MSDIGVTRDQSKDHVAQSAAPVPGLVLIFSERHPRLAAIPLPGGEVVLGRGECGGFQLPDACMSRRHARVRYDGQCFSIEDLGSRNGTTVDGQAVAPQSWTEARRIARMGDTLFMITSDIRPYQRAEVLKTPDGRIMGPVLQRAFNAIDRAARFGKTLYVAGESGVGKESAARAFHELGPHASGPFIAVNCAAIPEGIAERLLFGARRGAYSGASGDSEGYVQAADGGTLFLDEVADLDASVQGKLLRVLETREVLALGATRPTRVDLRICSATHKDLRSQVAAGRLREDLYFRIGRPEVAIPPLRERLEEIPWLIQAALERAGAELWSHVSLVETCLLRPWPGNVRELLTEIHAAAEEALASKSHKVEASHLSARAGSAFTPEAGPEPRPDTLRPPPVSPAASPEDEAKARLEAVLRQTRGNVSEAARVLGMHRTQLRRLLERHGIDARAVPRSANRS
jgi:DNA-binding NtrC family response regulator